MSFLDSGRGMVPQASWASWQLLLSSHGNQQPEDWHHNLQPKTAVKEGHGKTDKENTKSTMIPPLQPHPPSRAVSAMDFALTESSI